MTKAELKSILVRSIVLDFQNSKHPNDMSWGHDAPCSIYVARQNRIRLAKGIHKNLSQ